MKIGRRRRARRGARITLLAVALATAGPALAQPASPTAPAAPQAGEGPLEVVREAVDAVLAVLRDPTLKGPERRSERIRRIRNIVDRVFDWEEMARRSLGVHWRQLTPPQRTRFVDVFKDVLAAEYVNDFERFQGDEKVLVEDVTQVGDVRQVETTVITHSRERVPVHYFMHRQGGRWLVYDFSVEGISLVNHFRRSFSRFLVNNSFDQLMERLERRRRVITEVMGG